MTANVYRDDYSHTDLVTVNDDLYLVQGDLTDSIVMYREITDLLECERDSVNVMMGDNQ